MRATLALVLPLLLGSSVCQHAVGSGLNVTEHEQRSMPVLRTLDAPAAIEIFSSGVDYEEAGEKDVKEVMAPQFLVGDPGRGELQFKKPARSENGKKNPNKHKRRGNKEKKNKKKKAPCEGKFRNFCVHGECKYIEDLDIPTCTCHQNYFGERCAEQFLKTHRNNDSANQSTTVLMVYSTTVNVVVAVVLSFFSFVVIVIIIIVQIRKKFPKYDEKEERKKLRQENGSSHNGV
ncbi:amphiregulin [Elgaria multicarinata webbii]|uniref:amphiregulin n=1 Tax=Elgaria multicarinata webbii TaxID=159646 RepID=UPI002FCCC794